MVDQRKVKEIRNLVEKMIKSKYVKGFYSTYIQKKLNIPLEEVEQVLEEMIEERLLGREYELLCRNDFCLHVLDRKRSVLEFNEAYECENCGEEIEGYEEGYLKVRYIKLL